MTNYLPPESKRMGPARGASSVTPSDSANLPDGESRGLFVGTAGNVAVEFANGDSVTLNNLVAGIVHPLQVAKVLDTGTTAANILAIY